VTAAATGAIAGAAFVPGRRALVPTVATFAITVVLVVKLKTLPEPVVIVAAGPVGLAQRDMGAP
jgi:chromate transporter